MISLVLVRHAKSDWSDPALPDHDRPLNARGERDAPMMAHRFAASGSAVERLVSSTARRALTTASVFGEALGMEVEPDRRLYLAPSAQLLSTAADSDARAVMLVAHDPGLSNLAGRLSSGGIGHMPTCAVARFVWRVDSWSEALAQPPEVWTLDTPR